MRVIYKYKLEPESVLHLPKGAKVLCVHDQYSEPYLWVEVFDPASTKQEPRTFLTFATGEEMLMKDLKYIGTSFCGPFVWHTYELIGASS